MNTRSALMLAALSCLGTATGSLGIRAYQQSLGEDRDQAPLVPASPAEKPTRSLPRAPAEERTLEEVLSPRVIMMEPTVIEVKRPSAHSKPPRQPIYQPPQLQQLVQDTITYTQRTEKCAFVARKGPRLLELYCNGQLEQAFKMDLGSNPYADKVMEGDGTTPEGKYHIRAIKDRGQTVFYRALLIDYPNGRDWQEFRQAKRQGTIPKDASIGGEIEIHGQGGKGYDWTLGCLAVRNEDMDLIFDRYINKGRITLRTPLTIVRENE